MTGNSTAWKMVEIGNLIFREIELPGFSGQQKENNKAMRRIKLTVAYDGTAYKGWQLQPNGVTIEEMLNKALSDLLKEPASLGQAGLTPVSMQEETWRSSTRRAGSREINSVTR